MPTVQANDWKRSSTACEEAPFLDWCDAQTTGRLLESSTLKPLAISSTETSTARGVWTDSAMAPHQGLQRHKKIRCVAGIINHRHNGRVPPADYIFAEAPTEASASHSGNAGPLTQSEFQARRSQALDAHSWPTITDSHLPQTPSHRLQCWDKAAFGPCGDDLAWRGAAGSSRLGPSFPGHANEDARVSAGSKRTRDPAFILGFGCTRSPYVHSFKFLHQPHAKKMSASR